MFTIRRSGERGVADHGWLHSRHSFSFADYHDPQWMGWGNLRVINEDRIAPGTGFGTHGHRDMEIVSWVLDGALAHQDSMGNGARIQPGELQRMTAGTGVRHSEFNHAAQQATHFLQIWLLPAAVGLAPGYAQRAFPTAERRGRLRRIAAPVVRGKAPGFGGVVGADGADRDDDSDAGELADGVVGLHADATIFNGLFDGTESARMAWPSGRLGYLHVARGRLTVNGHVLQAGDALMWRSEPELMLDHGDGAEVLVFDLAP